MHSHEQSSWIRSKYFYVCKNGGDTKSIYSNLMSSNSYVEANVVIKVCN